MNHGALPPRSSYGHQPRAITELSLVALKSAAVHTRSFVQRMQLRYDSAEHDLHARLTT